MNKKISELMDLLNDAIKDSAFIPNIWSDMLIKNYKGPFSAQAQPAAPSVPPPCRRVGRFTLPDPLKNEAEYWAAMGIMARCVVVDATKDPISGHINYVAISPLFKEISHGAVIPKYEWVVEGDNVTARHVKTPPAEPCSISPSYESAQLLHAQGRSEVEKQLRQLQQEMVQQERLRQVEKLLHHPQFVIDPSLLPDDLEKTLYRPGQWKLIP